MTDAAFDRRLRDWLEDREPGPVPPSLRADVARVAIETPIPPAARVWQSLVGPGRAGREASSLRLALVLGGLGLLVAVAAALLLIGSRPAVLTAWHDFVVGRAAPESEFGSVTGARGGGDATLSVDDLRGSVIVIYLAGNA